MGEFSEIWLVTFGAKWMPGDGWQPSFLAARELSSRRQVTLDRITLFTAPVPPYPTDENALLVCFIGEAIIGCHIILKWARPSLTSSICGLNSEILQMVT